MKYKADCLAVQKTKGFGMAKKVAAVLLIIACIALSSGMAAAVQKSETVYAKLSNSGRVDNIYVVNRLIGSYTDFGSYTDIKNLSTTSVPSVDGDMISFPDSYVEGGLYYQGTAKGELPVSVNIRWSLDGKSISADSLCGASGRLNIRLNITPNELCDENVRKGLTTQISVPLNMKKAENISSNGASMTTAGSTATISHMILPGESSELVVEAIISDFEMEPITIALVNSNWTAFSDDIGELEDGIGEMIDGASDMADGMSELKSGAGSLTKGAKDLSNGLGTLSASGSLLSESAVQYGDGLNDYFTGAESIPPVSAAIQTGLNELAQNGQGISDGIAAVSGGLDELCSNTAGLAALAQSLLSSDDESVRELASGTIDLIDGIESVSGNLSSASAGLSNYMAGVNQTAAEYADFDDAAASLAQGVQPLREGYAELKSGIASYTDGVSQSAQGAQRIYRYLKRMPGGIQQLMDAQEEFKSGLNEMKDGIDMPKAEDNTAVSFASPSKNKPLSVQYILMTKGIEKPKTIQPPADDGNGKTVIDRFLDLFR